MPLVGINQPTRGSAEIFNWRPCTQSARLWFHSDNQPKHSITFCQQCPGEGEWSCSSAKFAVFRCLPEFFHGILRHPPSSAFTWRWSFFSWLLETCLLPLIGIDLTRVPLCSRTNRRLQQAVNEKSLPISLWQST